MLPLNTKQPSGPKFVPMASRTQSSDSKLISLLSWVPRNSCRESRNEITHTAVPLQQALPLSRETPQMSSIQVPLSVPWRPARWAFILPFIRHIMHDHRGPGPELWKIQRHSGLCPPGDQGLKGREMWHQVIIVWGKCSNRGRSKVLLEPEMGGTNLG